MTKEELYLALDVEESEKPKYLARIRADCVSFFEIRVQLFTSEGSRIVQTVRDYRGNVFLDLGFHDIPSTAANAPWEDRED